MKHQQEGLIHVYTGLGKGKTTASLGLAIRARAQGFKVIIIRFLKGNKLENKEKNILEKNNIEVLNINSYGYFEVKNNKGSFKKLINEIRLGWKNVEKILSNKKYQMVILDEINICLDQGIIPVKSFLKALKNKPKPQEIICTGRFAPKELIKTAHYVTELKLIKHPFTKGISARKGIEF